MEMDENMHNHGIPKGITTQKAFIIGIVINALYVIIELIAGFYYNSLSLISDAGHNLSDVGALTLALLAYRLAKVKANEKFTYGYRKSTILVSLINSLVIFVVIGGILWESFNRIQHPIKINGLSVALIAGIGILINAVSAMLFFRDKDRDLNIKGAYLHLMADAAVSLGVVVSGILILLFHIYWLDMLISIAIVLVIFYTTWNLFKDSLSYILDGVPKGVEFTKVATEIMKVEGVVDIHHIHVWALSTTQNAMTAHIIIHPKIGIEQLCFLKRNIKHELEHINIHHATLEFEFEGENCTDTNKI
jgi:cobalt-zinc-cadmium efflux system protein